MPFHLVRPRDARGGQALALGPGATHDLARGNLVAKGEVAQHRLGPSPLRKPEQPPGNLGACPLAGLGA